MSAQVTPILKQLKSLAQRPLTEATAPPKDLYTLPEICDLERERIFSRSWLCAGRADEVPSPGDYMTFELGPQPVLIIRGKGGDVHARANVCRHRMMRLVEGRGNARKFTCPYHAWTYNTEGRLVSAPYMDRTTCFERDDLALVEVRCEIYQGWIYVTLDPDILPVADQLADLSPLTARYNQQDYVTIFSEEHVWDTNWKCLTENFMESYHLPVAHRATVGAHMPPDEVEFDDRGAFESFTYQLFTKQDGAPVGRAHDANKSLEGRWRHTSVMPTVFPSHMYVLAPDHLWYLSLQPDGPSRTRIRYGAAIAPEVLEAKTDREAYIADTKAFLDKVQDEDRHVVEGIFKGAQSPLGMPGPLSWLERENHEFAQYIARRLCDPDQKTDA